MTEIPLLYTKIIKRYVEIIKKIQTIKIKNQQKILKLEDKEIKPNQKHKVKTCVVMEKKWEKNWELVLGIQNQEIPRAYESTHYHHIALHI